MAGEPSDNLYITGLPEGMDEASLKTVMGAYGTIAQSKLLPPKPGSSGAAMVRMASVDEAKWILENMSGNIPQGLTEPVQVAYAKPKQDWAASSWGASAGGGGGSWSYGSWGDSGKGKGKGKEAEAEAVPSDNLYITSLPEGIDEVKLTSVMQAYGSIAQCKMLPQTPGRNAAAMVRFGNIDEAKWVLENMNGNIPQGLEGAVQVAYAKPRTEWGKGYDKGYGGGPYDAGKGGWGGGKDDGKGGKGKGKGKKCDIRTLTKGLAEAGAFPGGPPGVEDQSVYIAGLPYDTTDTNLYQIFAPFGALKAVNVMMDRDSGSCKGIGFANFTDGTAAQMAIATLNGTYMPDGSWLTVKLKTDAKKGEGKGDAGSMGAGMEMPGAGMEMPGGA